jgi:hypothetical protein
MKKDSIGHNAGLVWNLLNCHCTHTRAELLTLSNLSETELAEALGWLAREDKLIFIDDDGIEKVMLNNAPYF